jgi:hypothetical protein
VRKKLRFGFWILIIAILGSSAIVQVPSTFAMEDLKESSGPMALILYHPSRDTHFSDDLSLALADGLNQGGVHVDRATMSPSTPDKLHAYKLIAVVSNTYYWTPDIPTLWYLRRAQFQPNALIGLIGGFGATERAQSIFEESLRQTGGTLIGTRSFSLIRPNDESRLAEPNRQVALDLARQFGRDTAAMLLRNPTLE